MGKWHVIYASVIGALAIALVAMLWLFVLAGKTTVVPDDTRQAIVLEPAEQALIRTEMRRFLAAVQAIIAAALHDDPAAIAQRVANYTLAKRRCFRGSHSCSFTPATFDIDPQTRPIR